MRVTQIRTLVRQHHRAGGGGDPLNKLRELRLMRGWSQAELAAAAGCSRRTIARLEAGIAGRVAARTLARVATVFGAPIAALFPELHAPASPSAARRKQVS